MSFKDQVKRDVSCVFFNLEEFGDTHEINGKAMTAIIDDNLLKEAPTDPSIQGIWSEQTTLYVKAEEYGDAPKRGSLILLDGQKHEVIDLTVEMGIYKITLGRWRSNGSSRRVF